MKKNSLTALFLVLSLTGLTQSLPDTSWKILYRGSAPKINDLVHTRLKVRFDFNSSRMHGEEWITVKPHFYPTDSLDLDAKQMDIEKVELAGEKEERALKYSYDGWHLRILLDRTYKAIEKYTLHISYTAKPEEAKVPDGSRGLHFIA
jgi:aminopeptidase N